MGLLKEVELIIPPKKRANKTLKVKSLNGYDAIREKLDEGNTMNVKQPVVTETPELPTEYRFVIKLSYCLLLYILKIWLSFQQVISLAIPVHSLLPVGLAMYYLLEVLI